MASRRSQPARSVRTGLDFGVWLFPVMPVTLVALCSVTSLLWFPLNFFLSFVAYWLCRVVYVQWKWGTFFKTVPHVPASTLLGHIFFFDPERLTNTMTAMIEQVGTIYSIWLPIGMRPQIALANPDALREVMSIHNVPKGLIMEFVEYGTSIFDALGSAWLGRGLLTSNFALWKSRRDLLTPAFHFQILQNYVHIFQTRAATFADRLDKLIDKDSTESKKSINIFPLCTDCTLDIITACAFGVDIGAQKDRTYDKDWTSKDEDGGILKSSASHDYEPYIRAIHEISELVYLRSFNGLVYNRIIYALTPAGRRSGKVVSILNGVADGLIKERKEHLQSHPEAISNKKRLDFLDILLTAKDENGEGLDDLAIRNEAATFLFEGHDTTASAIAWVFYLLASHPEYQRQVQEEIDQVLGDADAPTYEQAKGQLELLELCIKEALRLYPSVPFIVRNNDVEMNLNGYNVPVGTEITMLIYSVHRLPQYWQEPDRFWPERFKLHGIKHPFAYIPFSAGHRSCIGQVFALLEEKIVLASLLKKFEFRIDESVPRPDLQTHLISRPSNGVHVFVKRRHV